MTTNKKIIFYAALSLAVLAITAIAAETVSFAFLYIENGHWNSKAEIQTTLQKTIKTPGVGRGVATQDRSPNYMQQHILHPYLGFVRNVDIERHWFNGRVVKEPLNQFGFWGPEPPTSPLQDTYVIGIVGGSVAAELYLYGRKKLADALTEKNLPGNKAIMFVSIALGGMKQPQQTLALNYFLSIGRHFDAVINIDGFNEIVLPAVDNVPYKVNPFYPRNWRMYATKYINPGTVMLLGEISIINQKLDAWSRRLAKFPFRESYTVLAVWQQLYNRLTTRQRQLEKQLQQQLRKKKRLSAQESGPKYEYVSLKTLMEDSASVWQASSIQLWALCKENSIDYYHFLQPNQYFPDTHVPTDWERLHVISGPDYPYRKSAEAGYPFLQTGGNALRAYGVPFTDLSQVFKYESRSVYRDACCHYNQLGNAVLADAISAAMAETK